MTGNLLRTRRNNFVLSLEFSVPLSNSFDRIDAVRMILGIRLLRICAKLVVFREACPALALCLLREFGVRNLASVVCGPAFPLLEMPRNDNGYGPFPSFKLLSDRGGALSLFVQGNNASSFHKRVPLVLTRAIPGTLLGWAAHFWRKVLTGGLALRKQSVRHKMCRHTQVQLHKYVTGAHTWF